MREFSLLLLFWGCCGICRGVSLSPLGADPTSTGIGGCVDSTMCPDHAICHNMTSGRYYCECKQGYQPSNRQNRFVELGVTCQDVNECSQNPTPCGPHSECRNMRGRYRCSCLPGFSSPTGNNWVPGNSGNFSCTDINECHSNGTCPRDSDCVNSAGSYTCRCHNGFVFHNSACQDIDECKKTQTCPEHAICHNTVGSYHCVCKDGFDSTSGEVLFKGRRELCEDIDECSKNRTICGANSVCGNTVGGYNCSCMPGFRPTGVWTPQDFKALKCTGNGVSVGIKQKHGTGLPVLACRVYRACPNSICTNTLGSYSCTCAPGFWPESAQGHGNSRCKSNYSPGWVSAKIFLISLARLSVCRAARTWLFCLPTCFMQNWSSSDGFYPYTYLKSQEPGAPSGLPCGYQGPKRLDHPLLLSQAHEQGVSCEVEQLGFEPTSLWDSGAAGGGLACCDLASVLPRCKCGVTASVFSPEAPFKCRSDVDSLGKWEQQCHTAAAARDPQDAAYCRLMNSALGVLDNTCKNETTAATLKTAVNNLTSVLEQTSKRSSNFTREEASTLATALLESTKSSVLAALLLPSAAGNHSQTIRTPGLDLESQVVAGGCQEEDVLFNLEAKGDAMRISCSTIEESGSTGRAGVAFVSFVGLESLVDERFFRDLWDLSVDRLKMNSRVVSGILTGKKKNGFQKDVLYWLENIQPKQKHETPVCVSWHTDEEGGRWTRSGCSILNDSETYTVCRCRHITNLAVIMAPREVTVDFTLYIISHVGIILSLLCLALAVLTFLLCRSIRNHNTYMHAHLCACLFLAKLLFLIGFDKTNPQLGCALIAGVLHFLFLACFSWMLLEAITLFLTVRNLQVVNYFGTRHVRMLPLCAFGYGVPGLVVAISACVKPSGYGTEHSCWLEKESGFVWSFLGPVCTIIVVNCILLTWTLCILRQKLGSVNTEVSTLRDTRLLTFKAFAQLFILGCSWVLGLFQIGSAALVMAYLFTIINSFQGVFIFLIHCLLNRQVREQYRRWFYRQSVTVSQSQTTGMVLTSTLSSSKTS
ncbi:adhesion G protein-coupled receptor E1 [Ochotona princeps]|uniref:adhesion G protein-coupled receptor E1 n=1 Tax=Ochotona princeps TaxID=9978 RepID=UPI0027149438|nr:adhesion G protein-coupled receptor E1 [Ochotona princeps]